MYVYDDRRAHAELDVHTAWGRGAARRPAVMYVHGGGWNSGARNNDRATVDRLARAGYVGVNVDYRLVPEGAFPAAVQDVFCALAFIRERADELGINPERVAVMGHSAGAHLIGMVAVAADVPELQDLACPSGKTGAPGAAISVAGPMDLHRLGGAPTAAFVGASYDAAPETWAAASPINHVDAGEPPFLFVHSKQDLIVPIEQSEVMRIALRSAGNDVSILRLEGGGHVLGDGLGLGEEEFELASDTPESWTALIDFLDRTVGTP